MKVRKVITVVLSLTLFTFLQAPVINAKDTVARPFQISGVITFFLDGTYAIEDQRIASHLGKFKGVGTWYSGKYIAANGDELNWEVA